jgi:hypothetical protein
VPSRSKPTMSKGKSLMRRTVQARDGNRNNLLAGVQP